MTEKRDDTPEGTLATSPKDPVTGRVKPHGGPSERPGTEAEEARGEPAPPKPAGDAPPTGRRNSASPGDGA